jgi:acyl-CoA thioester hydrolase
MEGYRLVTEVPVRFADTDAMGHVNNAVYLSYLEAARVDYLYQVFGVREAKDYGVILARAEIDYKSPVFPHETVLVGCRVAELGASSVQMTYRLEEKASKRLVALAKTVIVAYDYKRGKPVRLSADWRKKMEDFDGLT